jgi:hypothetical protein
LIRSLLFFSTHHKTQYKEQENECVGDDDDDKDVLSEIQEEASQTCG